MHNEKMKKLIQMNNFEYFNFHNDVLHLGGKFCRDNKYLLFFVYGSIRTLSCGLVSTKLQFWLFC